MAIIDKPSDFFETLLSTGDGGSQTFTGLNFQPDFVWSKRRQTHAHQLYDSVRGAGSGKALQSDSVVAEGGDGGTYGYLSSFTSDGFVSTAGSSNNNYFNASGGTYAFWNWKAGTSFTNDASATGIGTIDSTGSVSDTSGFSIVSYTGTGSAGTIKHGLSTAPLITLIKSTTTSTNWNFLTYQIDGSCDELALNLSSEGKTDRSITAPTSSVFSVDTATDRNGSGVNFIAYCFSEKQSYSKFGSYEGNNNINGTFIYLGFKPAFLIIRSIDNGRNWMMYDNKRGLINVNDETLYANSNSAEVSPDNYNGIDFLSNGFKLRGGSSGVGNDTNGAETYLYMAFAENPFVASNFNPATAR